MKPILIDIEAANARKLDLFTSSLKKYLGQTFNILATFRCPTAGPIGRQLRVIEENRIKMHAYPANALKIIDKMDRFYNPVNGLEALSSTKGLILAQNYYLTDLMNPEDAELRDWLHQISSICPRPDIIIWLESEDTPIGQSESAKTLADLDDIPFYLVHVNEQGTTAESLIQCLIPQILDNLAHHE